MAVNITTYKNIFSDDFLKKYSFPIHRNIEIFRLENELMIATPEDWYRVSAKQLSDIGVLRAVQRSGSIANFLHTHRPEYMFDETRLPKFKLNEFIF